jgi:hypothetical protein
MPLPGGRSAFVRCTDQVLVIRVNRMYTFRRYPMTYHSIAKIALGALIVTIAGCKDSPLPLEPSAPTRGEPSSPKTPSDFPAPSSPAGIYDRTSASFIPGNSRYVIYENGTFSLQYVRPDWGFFEYPGKYSLTDSGITFQFDGWSVAGPWLADGIVAGNSLTVKYNVVMVLSDFEDGVYIRSTSGSANVTGG